MNEAFISPSRASSWSRSPTREAQEFGATDLGNFVKAIDLFIQHVAAITRTPPHYLVGQVVNASGDALEGGRDRPRVEDAPARLARSARAGRTRSVSPSSRGPPKAKAKIVETLWADMESRSLAEVADAAVKLKDVGVPRRPLGARRRVEATRSPAGAHVSDGASRGLATASLGPAPGTRASRTSRWRRRRGRPDRRDRRAAGPGAR
jgi:hypothetical protein